MKIMEDFQPDVYVSPSDCDTSIKSSTKRTCNSVRITNQCFENVYEAHTSSPVSIFFVVTNLIHASGLKIFLVLKFNSCIEISQAST